MGKSKKKSSKIATISPATALETTTTSSMDLDDVHDSKVGNLKLTDEEKAEEAHESEKEMEDSEVKMSGKAKKRAEMEAKKLLKVQVKQLKHGRAKLNKKDFAQKAERRALERELKVVVQETKDEARKKSQERHTNYNALPGASIH
mmetsp:Transcript_12926/g.17672  ORF Transcript_12926/g.17672 Transcript_12926/m.17672 type:complete len:146 (-) Transcript_12926:127-564(-)|eukprot:CAMPEP_0196590934 /NCGR_PEP_ID=MMETSP1081-20130531/67996_1 /TAXON_ID=36882 /ORGANISM="Pyramimonas amylifera, Strain CCMP720" /LENGTH=145 /DNA_ID=CAMNT_0041914167 /DNA_START=423 /DNA_END=860 /DNA_ORIENTATION=-